MLFQKNKIKIFEAEIYPSMTIAEIENEVRKISNTVEINKTKNPLNQTVIPHISQDVILVTRGNEGKQIIYEIVFKEKKLQYVVKSDRKIIFENKGGNN